MFTADKLRDLRAGPVIAAGRVNDATIRGLVANHDLRLGDREGREVGNPRYDLADCARVLLLHILVKKLRMRSEPAVWAVNKAYEPLALIAERELTAMGTGEAPDCPRYELRLSAMSLDTETNPEIRLYSDPQAVADRESNRGLMCEIVMDLREIVRSARNELVNGAGHSTDGLRHDFADAQDA